MSKTLRATCAVLAVLISAGCAAIPTQPAVVNGTTRFFQRCRHQPYIQVHSETSPWDAHNLLYMTFAVLELEVVRIVDWLLDVPVPGASIQPVRRSIEGARHVYYRLPPWLVITRAGELVDALQLPELSLGDANATYTVATGGTTGPGSGMVVRAYKVVDWSQHVIGDVNQGLGRLVWHPQGLVPWGIPDYGIDAAQWLVLKAFNGVSLLVTRTLDGALTTVEVVAEGTLNAGYQRPHERETVFLRMPIEVYRAHELWFLEHQARLRVVQPAQLLQETHASLVHQGVRSRSMAWSATDVPGVEIPELIVVTSRRVIARAPTALRGYVVPAAWVLEP